jgi:hypothetical protein
MGGIVSPVGEVEVYTMFWWGNLGKRENMEDLIIDGRIQ